MSHWIVFEGLDGCGKSTQARILAERLDALLVREPGGTSLGAALRLLVLNTPLDPWVQALLFAADRSHLHTTKILPALHSGRTVLSDRSVYSSYAYQGASGVPHADLHRVNRAVLTRPPDLVVHLRVPVAVSLSRRAGRDDDVIEARGAGYLEEVARNFDALAEDQRWVSLDATVPLDALAEAVYAAVSERLGLPDSPAR